jgi:hypothetical protein
MPRSGTSLPSIIADAATGLRPEADMLTVVTKSNAQRHAMVMWDEIAARCPHLVVATLIPL